MIHELSVQSNLRLAILDFPKKHLEIESCKRIMADMISVRQVSYHRTIETYILMDKNDMISTHLMIYDVSNLYAPKILSGIRLIHGSRCLDYGLTLPLEENIKHASLPTQKYFQDFKKDKSNLIECAGWYVDKDYSFSQSKIDLAEMIFFGLTTYLLRKGIHHFTGATNERFKGSRHVAKAGNFEEGHIFAHPVIKDPHKVTLVEQFNRQWLLQNFVKYESLLQSRFELIPQGEHLKTYEEIKSELLNQKIAA